jgi:L-ascorbate metabolism protein UlaG (beta-lactamase superfamily)
VVYIDPYFPHDRPADRFVHAEPPVDERDLPVDGVLFTHDHLDHTHTETVARLAELYPDLRYAGPCESATRVAPLGIGEEQFDIVTAGDCVSIGDIDAAFVYAKPPAGDPDNGIAPPDVTHLGIVLASGNARIYFSGDPIHTFAEHPALTDAVRALAPAAGFLTNHPSEGEFPFFDGCARMAERCGLGTALPAHYACFVKRDYAPAEWVAAFADSPVQPRVIAYNSAVLLP